MEQDIILKVQGEASDFVKSDISNFLSTNTTKKELVIFFICSSEFEVKKDTELILYDLNTNQDIGKFKLLEVHLPFHRVVYDIPQGHRVLCVFEIIKGNASSIKDEMNKFDRFDFVENRFFLYKGDFEKLYQKYYVH